MLLNCTDITLLVFIEPPQKKIFFLKTWGKGGTTFSLHEQGCMMIENTNIINSIFFS